MEFDDAIYEIFKGNCLLILGSGFSCGCETASGVKMPRADKLCDLLDAKSGEESDRDLGFAAEQFIEKLGEAALCEYLRDLFTPVEIGEEHKIIAGEDWRRVYTTNYDDIMEHGARITKHKRVEGVTISSDPKDYKDKSNMVIHLNGQLQNLSPSTLYDEFKLTKGSYLVNAFQESKWLDIFQFDLMDCDAIFIIGLSLEYDLDIARLIFGSGTRDKTFIITWEGEKPSAIKKMQKFGKVQNIGRDAFARQIMEAKATYIPPAVKKEKEFTSFKNVKIHEKRPVVNDDAIRKLLFWGSVDDSAVQFSVFEPENYKYFIYREKIDVAVNLIDNGEKNMVVHGNVGNGKSMFIKGLACKLIAKGYNVYWYNRETDETKKELERICGLHDKRTVIVLENYTLNKELIVAFSALRSDTIFITSERSAANDLHFDWLKSVTGSEFQSINLNRLTPDEEESLIELLDHVNLWGDIAGERGYKKRNFIEKQCKNELRSVLLELFNTKPIKDKLNEMFSRLGKNYLKSAVLLMLANYASFSLNLYDLAKALDDDTVTSSAFERNEFVREFIDFSTWESKATSSIMAEFVLTRLIEPKFLIDTLSETFRKFDLNTYKYGNVLSKLSQHSTILSLIGRHSEEARALIPEYYDGIKNSKWCKYNPHFWLQYAIAMLNRKEYPEACLYFQNAYSYSRDKKSFNTIQIDNHYARYLLENAIENEDDNYWESFQKAHSILTDPLYLKDKKYYPYKVARFYLPFYKKYCQKMNNKQLLDFRNSCDKMLQMLEKYASSIEKGMSRRDVEDARIGLQEIITQKITIKK